jgi:two-component system, cell cycle sensor histidine kinase and response regulator CckA
MNKILKILHLEDDANDAQLLRLNLEEANIGCAITVVQTRDEFAKALEQTEFDLIVSDFTLPSFDGNSALEIARQEWPDIPFIFVSGTMGEDAVIESMVRGATDYVLKGRLSRLVPATQRALLEAESRRERKRAEVALKESKEKYQSLFEKNLSGAIVSTPDGRLLECNAAFVRMFGFDSIEDAKATNVSTLYPDPEKRRVLLSTLEARKEIEYLELHMIRKDGAPVRVIENVVGKFDNDGKLVELTSYMFDDTKRQLLEQQLIQAQKLESLGTLASGIAHDFNNILSIIIGHATLIQRLHLEPDKIVDSIKTITTAAQRGAALVRQLLTFARKSDVILQRISLNDVITEVVSLTRETFPKTVTVSMNVADKLPTILADSTQIEQVFLNLCVNARDAMPNGGTLSLSTQLITGEKVQARFPEAKASEYVLIEAADTGIGMDEATQNRIFEPFFTTKEPGKGTGLGLAVAFGIIHIHQGFIDVSSEPGHGTTFSIYFPVNLEELEPFEITQEMLGDTEGGTETILLVEDEEMLRSLTKMVLKGKGYNVVTASDGEEAVRMFILRQNDIALVLSDMGLPKLSGYDVLKEVKRIKPDVKFIIASGYIEAADKSEILESGARDFIQKPYVPNEMLRKIRRVLDEK